MEKLNALLLSLGRLGLKPVHSPSIGRNLMITNTIAIIFIGASLLISVYVYFNVIYFQPFQWMLFPLILSFILPLVFNRLGFSNLARILLSCLPSLSILTFSIVAKLKIEDITFNDYYNFRIGLISLCIIPFLLFSLDEKTMLCFSAGWCFLCLALSDVGHHFFNVGYFDLGFTDSHYNFINFPSMVSALSIIGAQMRLPLNVMN